MASDGGPLFPWGSESWHCVACGKRKGGPGASVRDGFAMELAGRLYPVATHVTDNDVLAREVYDFAQAMTDEKRRRDKADRDEGKPG